MVPPAGLDVIPRARRSPASPPPPLSAIPHSRGSHIPRPAEPGDDATGRVAGLDRPAVGPRRPGLPPLVPLADATTPEPGAEARAPEAAATGDPAAPRGSRRWVAPTRHRGVLLLVALVLGGALAAMPTLTGLGPTVPTASAADFGLGNDVDIAGDMGDADVRASITEAEAQLRLRELAASRADRQPHTVLPAQGALSTCYCMRWGTFHYGIDLAAPLGTPIYAATDGVVLRAGPASGFGNAVYIEDTDGNVEVYGHMKYYSVKAGQVVHAGDQIAKVGNEGESTGPHLHFQIDRGSEYGKPINPVPWLQARGVTVPGN